MKIVSVMRTHCPHCNKHTEHKVKLYKKGKESPFSVGQARYKRQLRGTVGKVKGKKTVKKMGKHQRIVITCQVCKKKGERVVGSRTRKILEVVKVSNN